MLLVIKGHHRNPTTLDEADGDVLLKRGLNRCDISGSGLKEFEGRRPPCKAYKPF